MRLLRSGLRSARLLAWTSPNTKSLNACPTHLWINSSPSHNLRSLHKSVRLQQQQTVDNNEIGGSTRSFEAETSRLLDIVVRSLYSEREVFLRELVSNASDALERVRFDTAQSGASTGSLQIKITPDSDNGTLTIEDTGSGMDQQELEQNLGTIARSGTRAFVEKAQQQGGDSAKSLIGEFGVGFYSAFLVANEVEVITRRANGTAFTWRSAAVNGTYTIREASADEAAGLERGTRVKLYLKEDAKNFATEDSVRNALQKYSSFVPHPIIMQGETLNELSALLSKSPSEISNDEHAAFYSFITGSAQRNQPQYNCTFSADAPLSIRALLYFPPESPELAMQRVDPGINLYCRGVLVERNARVVPDWLRLLKGAVDCEDIPLNITRENLQSSRPLQQITTVVTKRAIKTLKEEANKDNDDYSNWFSKCGQFIKEGVIMDTDNQKDIAELLRYDSTYARAQRAQEQQGEAGNDSLEGSGASTNVSLADYVSRMPEGQESIYYFVSSSDERMHESPYVEGLARKGVEVLLMSQPIDEFVMQHLNKYRNYSFVNVEGADIKAPLGEEKEGDEGSSAESKDGKLFGEQLENFCKWMQEHACKGSVQTVRASDRLVDSPAILVGHEPESVRKWRAVAMQAAGTNSGTRKLMEAHADANAVLEVNPSHPLIRGLAARKESDEELAALVGEQVYENAKLAAGATMDTRGLTKRMNKILERVIPPVEQGTTKAKKSKSKGKKKSTTASE